MTKDRPEQINKVQSKTGNKMRSELNSKEYKEGTEAKAQQ